MALEGRRVAVTGASGPWRDALTAGLGDAAVADGVDLVVHVAPAGTDRPLLDLDETTWDALADAPVCDLLDVLQRAHRAGVPQVVVVVPSISMEGAAGLVA